MTCKFIPIRTYLSSPAPRSATEYPWPDVHADSGQAVVSSTGCEGVSDLPARTSLMNPMSKPSASGDHGQRDLWSTHQSTHNNSALALNSTCDVSGKVSTHNIDSAFNRLANTLHEGFNLPKPELLTFSGRFIDYCKFIKNFETNLECKVYDDRLRLSYLTKYCVG